jgi:hypothetical protein
VTCGTLNISNQGGKGMRDTDEKVNEILDNREICHIIRDLILEGYEPIELYYAALKLQHQLARITTGGND